MNRSSSVILLFCVFIRSFSYSDEPTVNSRGELAMATAGSHNLPRRSNG